jgi:hypothetical protein
MTDFTFHADKTGHELTPIQEWLDEHTTWSWLVDEDSGKFFRTYSSLGATPTSSIQKMPLIVGVTIEDAAEAIHFKMRWQDWLASQ